jgi:peptidoglycan/LPS O-acetylase OafA/YrhL
VRIKYRPELDGLRAIAVIAVILYHYDSKNFSNGFLGVDIFFVISGYLISLIIYNNKKFDYKLFIEKRFRRIIPLLFFVSFVTSFFSIFFLSPSLLNNLAKSVITVSLFSSNIFFWLTTGSYFDLIAELKPLIHTWSLGLELQFYLIFPLILIFLYNRNLLVLFLILFLLSFFFSLFENYFTINIFGNQKSLNSFYFLHTRFWEFILGFLAAVLIINKRSIKNTFLYFISVFLILISLFSSFEKSNIYSFNSLLPCIGTFLFIVNSEKKNFIFQIFTSRPLLFIGIISYSLYLWHQPIFSIYRIYFNNQKISYDIFFLLIFLIILLSQITYKYIERPFRNYSTIDSKKFYMIFFIFNFLLIIMSLFIIFFVSDLKYSHLNKLYPNINFTNSEIGRANRDRDKQLNLYLNNKVEYYDLTNTKPKILILGSSHGEDLFISLRSNENILKKYSISFSSIGQLDFKQLERMNDFIISDYVIIDTNYLSNLSLKELKNIKEFFQLNNKIFVIITPSPYFRVINDNPLVYVLNKFHLKEGYAKTIDISVLEKSIYELIDNNFFTQNEIIIRNLKSLNINFLDKSKLVCPLQKQLRCFAITHDKKNIYFDNTHTSLEGAIFFGKIINSQNWFNINNFKK